MRKQKVLQRELREKGQNFLPPYLISRELNKYSKTTHFVTQAVSRLKIRDSMKTCNFSDECNTFHFSEKMWNVKVNTFCHPPFDEVI